MVLLMANQVDQALPCSNDPIPTTVGDYAKNVFTHFLYHLPLSLLLNGISVPVNSVLLFQLHTNEPETKCSSVHYCSVFSSIKCLHHNNCRRCGLGNASMLFIKLFSTTVNPLYLAFPYILANLAFLTKTLN